MDETAAAPVAPPATPRRPGHRGTDVRDTVAELTARAQELSLEAGSKIAGAMKDVINAAAGITGFAVDSARDLAQYMVRRGQISQDEADRLIREAEEGHARRQTGEFPAVVSGRPPAPTVVVVESIAAKATVPAIESVAPAVIATVAPAAAAPAPATAKVAAPKKPAVTAKAAAKPAAKAKEPARATPARSAKATKAAVKPTASKAKTSQASRAKPAAKPTKPAAKKKK